jgi:hypothetical protein
MNWELKMKNFRIAILSAAATLNAVWFMAPAVMAEDPPATLQVNAHEATQIAENKIGDALSKLTPEDHKLATSQRFCAVMPHVRLGAMGTPAKTMIDGKPVCLCCQACSKKALADGTKTLKTVDKLRDVTEVLAKLSVEERTAIESQKYCVVADGNFLGAMGAPVKVEIEGKAVYLCCAGCKKKAQANPAETLAKVEELKQAGQPHAKTQLKE